MAREVLHLPCHVNNSVNNFLKISLDFWVFRGYIITSKREKNMKNKNEMNNLQFKNEVLALVSEDALPMVDALTEQGLAEGWTPAEVAGQCEADA